MAMLSLRPAHGVLFVLVAVLFFGLAMWMQRGGEPAAPWPAWKPGNRRCWNPWPKAR